MISHISKERNIQNFYRQSIISLFILFTFTLLLMNTPTVLSITVQEEPSDDPTNTNLEFGSGEFKILWSHLIGSNIRNVFISDDGRFVVATDDRSTIYGFLDGEISWSHTSNWSIQSIDVPNDGRYVVFVSGGILYMINSLDGNVSALVDMASRTSYGEVDVTPDGDYFSTIARTILRDFRLVTFSGDGEIVGNLSIPLNSQRLSISDDGEYIATANQSCITLLSINYGTIWDYSVAEFDEIVIDIHISSSFIFIGTNLSVRSISYSGELMWVTDNPFYYNLIVMGISADQNFMIILSPNSYHVMDCFTGQIIWVSIEEDVIFYDASISPENSYIVFGSQYSLNFRDSGSSESIFNYSIGLPFFCVSISSNGRYVVAGTDSEIYVFFYAIGPVADFTISNISPIIEEAIMFNASLSYDPDGTIVEYIWEIKDASTGIIIENFNQFSSTTIYSFSNPGDYNVTLTIIDDNNLSSSITQKISILPKYNLIIEIEGQGDTNPNQGTYSYYEETEVIVEATVLPDSGWKFDHWELNGQIISTDKFYRMIINDNYRLRAVFVEEQKFSLTIKIDGARGATSPRPGTYSYEKGETVIVEALLTLENPPSLQFEYWNLDGNNVADTTSYTILMDDHHTLTAVFSEFNPTTIEFIISVIGNGDTIPAPGIYNFSQHSGIQVEAVPDNRYEFNNWLINGSEAGSENPYIITTLEYPISLTAVFKEENISVSLILQVIGSGKTTPVQGIHIFRKDFIVDVSCSPDTGWKFQNWDLDGNNLGNRLSYAVKMDMNHTLTAIFEELKPETFGLSIGVIGSGTTDPKPDQYVVDSGVGYEVFANPANGWALSHWLLDDEYVENLNPYNIIMDRTHDLKAVFIDVPAPSINVISRTPNNPSEDESVTVQFTISCESGNITDVVFLCRISGQEWKRASLNYEGEIWTGTIPGNNGGEIVDFYIESMDSLGNIAVSDIFTYEVLGPPLSLDIVIVIAAAGTGVTLGSIGIYRVFYRGQSFSSKKLKQKAEHKNRKEEEKEEKENKKRKQKSKKGKPYLETNIKFPSSIIAIKSYKLDVKVINKGLATAKNIRLKVDATPGLIFDKYTFYIDELKPGKEKPAPFTFRTDEHLEKGIYKIDLNISSEDTKERVYTRILRGLKIGLLLCKDNPTHLNFLKKWFKDHEYWWNELSNADDYLKLRLYNLLILGPELKLGKNEVKNISKFVKNGEAILVFDISSTDDPNGFMKILGYTDVEIEKFKSPDGILRIVNNQNPITKDFSIEQEIPIGSYRGHALISNSTGEMIVEQKIKTQNGDIITIPAIIVNNYENGKSIHVNFCAKDIYKINTLLENAIIWSIDENS